MKKYMHVLTTLIVGMLFSSMSVAGPTLDTLVVGADALADDGTVIFRLTDTDGINDDTNAFLFLENAGYATSNEFGFYSYVDPSIMLTVFSGSDAVGDNATVSFGAGGVATSAYGTETLDSFLFGLFLTSPDGTFYSDSSLNADGVDHFVTFATEGSTGLAGVFEYIIGIEDVYGGGDFDYNDMVLGITDVEPRSVPEPTPLALMGFGLLFMRHRIKNRR